MDRRKFVKLGAVGVAAGIVSPVLGKTSADTKTIDTIQSVDWTESAIRIVSTWQHGMAANEAGYAVLQKGGSSLDAVEAAARQTESDLTNRSVGAGGRPDAEGHVTLDACIMDSDSRCGSVGYLEGIAHPISVARHIMEHTPHVMLVGAGAKKYALKNKFETIKTPLKEVRDDWKEWRKQQDALAKKPAVNHENHDTIGILAIDSMGKISGACTTSGWAYKLPGRLGDSPIIGAGLFIDQEIGGAVATGLGEAIIRVAGSHTVVELMRHGRTPQQACEEAVARIISKHSDMTGLQCAFLAIDKFGNTGAYSVFEGFNFAVKDASRNELVNSSFDRKW